MGYSSADPANYLAFAKQANEATEATTGFKFLKYLGDSGMSLETTTESVYEGGDGQDQGLHYKSKVKPDGQAQVFARPDSFAFLSAWALGSGVTPPSTALVASHVYTPNATIPALTMEQAWGGGNQIERVLNTVITGFQVEAEAGMPWRVTVPFIGGGTPYVRNATQILSPTLESGDPAMFAGGAYVITGATSLDVTRWSYNFTRNVDEDLHTNTVFRRKVIPLSRSVELSMQLIWQDQALWKQIDYGASPFVTEALASGAFHAERQLTASQLIAIDVPALKWTNVEVNRLEPDGQTVVLDLSAKGVKGSTGICQHRINVLGTPTSYLV